MPRDVNGNVTLPTNDSSPAVPRNVIRSSDFNEIMGDISSMMQDSLSRSSKGGMTADLDLGGNDVLNAANIPTNARAVNTGTGLTGGGDLSADRTIALNAASIDSLVLADSSIQPEDVALSLVNFPGADDNAKFTAAIAAAAALGNGATLFVPRGTYSITQKTVPANVRIALDKGAVIQPSGATASLFNFTGGLSGISGGLLVNTGSLATDGIIVAKPANDLSCVIHDVYMSQFTRAVRLTSGDCLKVTDCTGVSNGTFVRFDDDGRNSTISGNYAIGGNGVSLQKVTQGAEGVYIQNNGFLPASGTFCVQLLCGLEISILGNIFDQVTTGPAIIVDGQTNAIHSIKIESNWIGRQAAAANADYGLYVVGNVRDVKSFNNTYVGWQEAGVYFNGLAPGTLLYCKSIDDTFYDADPCLRDIQLENAENTTVRGATFSGTISIVEGSGVTGRVDLCDFSSSINPSTISSGLRYGRQTAGMTLRAKGTATLAQTTKIATVTHTLSYTPTAQDIKIEANGFPSNAPGEFVADTIGGTTFRAVCRNDPGASGAPVKWEANIER